MPVYRLSQELWFPDPSLAEPDGLLAVGGDLSVGRLRLAYANGIFPWYSEEPIMWFSPDPRMVIFPEKLRVSRSLAKTIKRGIFRVSFNKDFNRVIENCARSHSHRGTWITDAMIEAYTGLHRSGEAISVEVYREGELVGGLYGVISGPVFCGESMFHLVPDASKVALAALAGKLLEDGFELIDAQMRTPHIERFGGEFISRDLLREYLRRPSPGFRGN